MKHFAEGVVVPFITELGYRRILEIGASYGENTDLILTIPGVEMTLIDPCFDEDLVEKYRTDPRVTVHRGNSLPTLPGLAATYDCILIDGDHNWYTVYNELRLIREGNLLRRGGTILMHDVGFPYARRDLYYQPDTIPDEYRHPYARKGIVDGRSELVDEGGTCPDLYNATHEGGPRNGVLTAAEDFIAEHRGEYGHFRTLEEFGLGFICRHGSVRERALIALWQFRVTHPRRAHLLSRRGFAEAVRRRLGVQPG